jgi:acetyltransferase-like isoleucine patch superfamily enzyme
MCGAEIHPTAWIGHGVYVASGRGLKLGKNTNVNNGSYLDSVGGITFEEEAGCGPRCILITGTHKVENALVRADKNKTIHSPIVVGPGTWIQVGVTICPGVTIGHSAIVLVGSIVTKDVKPNCVYGGSPARKVQELPLDGEAQVVSGPAVVADQPLSSGVAQSM